MRPLQPNLTRMAITAMAILNGTLLAMAMPSSAWSFAAFAASAAAGVSAHAVGAAVKATYDDAFVLIFDQTTSSTHNTAISTRETTS